MSTPHKQIPEFENRNNFLWFLLGLHSVSRTVREVLSPAPNAARPAPRRKTGERQGRAPRRSPAAGPLLR